MMDTKIPSMMLLTLISPVLLYDIPYRYPNSPMTNRRSFSPGPAPEGLAPYYSYGTPYAGPYRFETSPQYNRPVRSTGPAVASPKSDMMPAASGQYPKRSQRAPGPKYAQFTLNDASAGYLNLPHGFQNPIKPAGFSPGNLFTAYKYGPAAAHVPLNSLAGAAYYGQASNSNRGPVIYPDTQTEKPIEEPLQEVPVIPTPVAELTKAAVLHQHMFSSPSTAKPLEVTGLPADQNIEYEVKYVPVYVDEESGKEVKTDELSNYRLKYEVGNAKAYVPTPTKSSVAYKYVPAPAPYSSVASPSATSYKFESQKFIPSGYESSLSSVHSLEGHEKDYPHYAPKYEFGYRVHDSYTGSDFGQSEHRDGEVTKGSYHVLLPDGRHQTVNYWSDDSGFHAKVKYDGVAKHYPAPTKASYDHSVDSNAIHS